MIQHRNLSYFSASPLRQPYETYVSENYSRNPLRSNSNYRWSRKDRFYDDDLLSPTFLDESASLSSSPLSFSNTPSASSSYIQSISDHSNYRSYVDFDPTDPYIPIQKNTNQLDISRQYHSNNNIVSYDNDGFVVPDLMENISSTRSRRSRSSIQNANLSSRSGRNDNSYIQITMPPRLGAASQTPLAMYDLLGKSPLPIATANADKRSTYMGDKFAERARDLKLKYIYNQDPEYSSKFLTHDRTPKYSDNDSDYILNRGKVLRSNFCEIPKYSNVKTIYSNSDNYEYSKNFLRPLKSQPMSIYNSNISTPPLSTYRSNSVRIFPQNDYISRNSSIPSVKRRRRGSYNFDYDDDLTDKHLKLLDKSLDNIKEYYENTDVNSDLYTRYNLNAENMPRRSFETQEVIPKNRDHSLPNQAVNDKFSPTLNDIQKKKKLSDFNASKYDSNSKKSDFSYNLNENLSQSNYRYSGRSSSSNHHSSNKHRLHNFNTQDNNYEFNTSEGLEYEKCLDISRKTETNADLENNVNSKDNDKLYNCISLSQIRNEIDPGSSDIKLKNKRISRSKSLIRGSTINSDLSDNIRLSEFAANYELTESINDDLKFDLPKDQVQNYLNNNNESINRSPTASESSLDDIIPYPVLSKQMKSNDEIKINDIPSKLATNSKKKTNLKINSRKIERNNRRKKHIDYLIPIDQLNPNLIASPFSKDGNININSRRYPKRLRSAPLKWYLGERIEYHRDKKSELGYTIAAIHKVTNTNMLPNERGSIYPNDKSSIISENPTVFSHASKNLTDQFEKKKKEKNAKSNIKSKNIPNLNMGECSNTSKLLDLKNKSNKKLKCSKKKIIKNGKNDNVPAEFDFNSTTGDDNTSKIDKESEKQLVDSIENISNLVTLKDPKSNKSYNILPKFDKENLIWTNVDNNIGSSYKVALTFISSQSTSCEICLPPLTEKGLDNSQDNYILGHVYNAPSEKSLQIMISDSNVYYIGNGDWFLIPDNTNYNFHNLSENSDVLISLYVIRDDDAD